MLPDTSDDNIFVLEIILGGSLNPWQRGIVFPMS